MTSECLVVGTPGVICENSCWTGHVAALYSTGRIDHCSLCQSANLQALHSRNNRTS